MFKQCFKLSRKIRIFNLILKYLYGCQISREVKMGKNITFPHNAMGVVIHPRTVIGDNVCIQHHVLCGEKNGIEAPVICDNVIVNPYSIIIGKVTIGENSIIGAGSVVTKDVPPNSVYYNRITPIIKQITGDERKKMSK